MARGIGIDIGADTVKVVHLRTGGGAVEVLGAASFSRHALGVDGSDAVALARAAAAHAAEMGMRGNTVAGLTGKDVILRYMSVPPAPLWKLRQLMDYEVGEITGADPSEFACDFRPLNLPSRAVDEFLLLVAVARNELLEGRIAAFEAGGLSLECLCPDSVALFNVLAGCVEAEPGEVVALLDVGAAKTEVVLMRNQSLVFARSVMPGGDEFTEAIAETLDVSLERAEEIKRRRGAVLPPDEIRERSGHEAEFYDALAAVAGQLVRAVHSTLMFARTQTKLVELEPARYYLCGGGARLGALRDHLERALGKPVAWLDVAAGVACEGAVAEPPSPYGVALGLAMAAASPGAFALRLVPERVRRRRHFRRKGVFAWAAGALAALVLLTSVVGTVHNWRASRRQVAMLEQGIEAAAADEARCQEARRDLDELRHKISLLADRVRANAFALRTLDALRRHTPAAIRIRSAQIAPEPPRGRAAGRPPQRLAFHLKGVATKRGALDASQELDEFVRRLAGPPIGAKPLRQTRLATPVGDRVDFELVFSPSASLIEE